MLVVPADGPVALLTDSAADLDRAREQAVCDEVVPRRRSWDRRSRPACAAARGRRLTGRRRAPGGGDGCPPRRPPGVRWMTPRALTAGLRMVKSPAELALLAEAARISDLGMARRPRRRRRRSARGRDGRGRRARDPRGRAPSSASPPSPGPGRGPRSGRSFRATGRCGPARPSCSTAARASTATTATCAARSPSASRRRSSSAALEAVAAAVEAGTAAARPGALVGDLREAARGAVVAAGLGEAWWGEFMPHGAGTGQHEPPYGDRDPACELCEGMVLCIEPGVLLPGDGRRRARADDRVTRRGAGAEPAAAAHVALEEPVFVGRTVRVRCRTSTACSPEDEHVHLVSREHEVVLVGPFLRACIVLTACSYTAVRIAGDRGAAAAARCSRVGVLGVLAVAHARPAGPRGRPLAAAGARRHRPAGAPRARRHLPPCRRPAARRDPRHRGRSGPGRAGSCTTGAWS